MIEKARKVAEIYGFDARKVAEFRLTPVSAQVRYVDSDDWTEVERYGG